MTIAILGLLMMLAGVVWIVAAPLRAGAPQDEDDDASSERDSLEAAKQAKYAEIRDSELDHRTGKLSQADFEVLDRQLRAEAVEILREIDRSN